MDRYPRFFYGWVVVGITVVSMILIYGIRHSFSVFFPSILDEFGWRRGGTAIMLSLNILIYGFLAPVAGSLGDRWKPRRVMPIGIAILGLATASCAFANELWHFYLLFGVLMPIGSAFSGWPLLAPALANWFAKRLGLVMGLGQMGGGLSFAYTMFSEFTISHLGWRYAFFVLAGTLVALLLPLYLLFFHYRPEDRGLRPYGSAELSAVEGSKKGTTVVNNPLSRDWTLGTAMGTYQLWFMVLSYSLFWGVGAYLVLAHQVRFTVDVGYSSMFSASVFGLFGIFLAAGQASAFISDWIGREKTITVAAILSIGALVTLLSIKDTSQPELLYLYATCFGYGTGLYSPTIVAGTADIFHGRHFGGIAALLLTGMGAGGAIGPWLGGYIYDISGSYRSAFLLCMACFGIACIAVWIAAPRNAARLRVRFETT
ncbi:MAG: MFS transporter [Thermodesulfobacteriota bacterium]